MKLKIMFILSASILLNSCNSSNKNPLLEKWETPFGTPPFNKINNEHYIPAFNETIRLHNSEIDKISKSSINCCDNAGSLKVLSHFFSNWEFPPLGRRHPTLKAGSP